jgi:hypothetical protein
MLHILFNLPDLAILEEVQKMDDTLQGPIHIIRDDFAVGPIASIDTEEGWTIRLNWWRSCYENSSYQQMPTVDFDDRQTVVAIRQWLQDNPDESCLIWMAQNQHDVAGYYWLVGQLAEFQGRILVIYLNNLPFINEKGQLFYPNWLSEIPVREFLKAKKLARPITTSEFEIDPDEWRRLAQENLLIRILEGGKKIVGKEIDYFDFELKRFVMGDWQRVSRIIANALAKMKVKTGDVFLMSRLHALATAGSLETNGKWERGWKELECRRQGGLVTTEVESN